MRTIRPAGFDTLLKKCPTCTAFIRQHHALKIVRIGLHQGIDMNTHARRPKWHHTTKVGRAIHREALKHMDELIDNSTEGVAAEQQRIATEREKLNEWAEAQEGTK